MGAIKGELRRAADLQVSDVFWRDSDQMWYKVTQSYLHPQSSYNKVHVDALADSGVKNLYLKLPLTMPVTAKPRVSMKQQEADARSAAVVRAGELANTLKQELLDYAQILSVKEPTVLLMGVTFEVGMLQLELAKRIRATESQIANMVKQL